MKKEMQIAINSKVEAIFEEAMNEKTIFGIISKPKKLRSCKATVYETANYYFLYSYNTIVAVIEKSTDTVYDFLRMVYGYTPTSAQHIAKFRHDYGAGKWGCEHSMTWYSV